MLLAQRPAGKAYAGYWEFPGGKLEPGETPRQALERELAEELGITVRRATPWLVQRFRYPHAHVQLHFFRVHEWDGEPVGHDGQAFVWQSPGRFDVVPLLPANTFVLRALLLPPVYGISMAEDLGEAAFLARATAALDRGLKLVQLREKTWPLERQRALADALVALARPRGAKVLLNGDVESARAFRCDGVHLTSSALAAATSRPDDLLCAASCHTSRGARASRRAGARFRGAGAGVSHALASGRADVGLGALRGASSPRLRCRSSRWADSAPTICRARSRTARTASRSAARPGPRQLGAGVVGGARCRAVRRPGRDTTHSPNRRRSISLQRSEQNGRHCEASRPGDRSAALGTSHGSRCRHRSKIAERQPPWLSAARTRTGVPPFRALEWQRKRWRPRCPPGFRQQRRSAHTPRRFGMAPAGATPILTAPDGIGLERLQYRRDPAMRTRATSQPGAHRAEPCVEIVVHENALVGAKWHALCKLLQAGTGMVHGRPDLDKANMSIRAMRRGRSRPREWPPM